MGARRSALFVLLLTVFVDLVGFGIVIPLLPRYAERFSTGRFELGLVLSLFSLMQFLTAPFWGRLSDRIGRRPVLIVTLFISLKFVAGAWAAGKGASGLDGLLRGGGGDKSKSGEGPKRSR